MDKYRRKKNSKSKKKSKKKKNVDNKTIVTDYLLNYDEKGTNTKGDFFIEIKPFNNILSLDKPKNKPKSKKINSEKYNFKKWDKLPFKKVDCVQDLLKIINLIENKTDKHFPPYLYHLIQIKKPLERLESLIGLNDIKKKIIQQIIYLIISMEEENINKIDKKFEEENKGHMFHTIIEGPPGVGKTKLAKIIGSIFYNMEY